MEWTGRRGLVCIALDEAIACSLDKMIDLTAEFVGSLPPN